MELKSFMDYDGEGYRDVMTRDQTETLLRLMMMENASGTTLEEADDEVKKVLGSDPICQIFTHRMNSFGVSASPAATMFVSMDTDGRPGTAVMWAYTFVAIAEKNENPHVAIAELVDAFPWGFPTERAKRECWEAQKAPDCPNGNAVDKGSNWVWPGLVDKTA